MPYTNFHKSNQSNDGYRSRCKKCRKIKNILTLEQRFWRKVLVKDKDYCWEWQGSKASFGHGTFWNGNTVDSAHRISWELHKGKIPDDMCVLHHCDNPSCVNPNHLFIGTRKDNVIDMVEKGRNRTISGESHPNAKLNEENVLEIRKLYKTGEYSQRKLAKIFNVSKYAIRCVIKRKSWKTV